MDAVEISRGSPLIRRVVSKRAKAQNPINIFLKIKKRKNVLSATTKPLYDLP